MSPRSKEQNAIIKDERREQLLSAALRVFAHKGLAATKIGDIAAAAKLSHGLVYHYFDSKDDIFTELVRRAVYIANDTIGEIGRRPLEPIDKLRAIAETTMVGIAENEDGAYNFYLMMQAFASDAGPEKAKEHMRELTVPAEVTCRAVAEGQAKGQVREGDPMEYAMVFWSAIQGLAVNRIASGAHFKMPDSSLLVRMFEKQG